MRTFKTIEALEAQKVALENEDLTPVIEQRVAEAREIITREVMMEQAQALARVALKIEVAYELAEELEAEREETEETAVETEVTTEETSPETFV